MIKLGIIGAGRLGSFHADKAAAHEKVELVGVADPSESARKKIAEKHRIREFADLEELLPVVDAVVIAAPTFLHYELGMPCLRQGRHVLMEKPMCASWSEARNLVAAAQRSNVVFMVGHVEEFSPAWAAALPTFQEIREGAPCMIETVRTSGYTFRSTDIGTVFDMMIHDIDLVLSLVPSRVIAVDALGFNLIGGSHEDTASARIRFENGAFANLFSSRVASAARREMTVMLPSGTTKIDFGSRVVTTHRPAGPVAEGVFAPDMIGPEKAAELAPTFMQNYFETTELHSDAVDALSLEMNDFVTSIESGRPPRVSGERALAAVALAEKIVESISKEVPLQFGHPGRRKAA